MSSGAHGEEGSGTGTGVAGRASGLLKRRAAGF